jgi:hypothetical protein
MIGDRTDRRRDRRDGAIGMQDERRENAKFARIEAIARGAFSGG